MSLSSGERRLQRGGREQDEIEGLAKCILRGFSHISVERFHKLAFMIEYRYFYENEERLTPAEYELILDGCHSEELQSVVDELEGVSEKTVKIAGESVPTLEVQPEYGCGLNENAKNTVDFIVDEYGDAPRDEINDILQSLSIYQETNLGNILNFEEHLN